MVNETGDDESINFDESGVFCMDKRTNLYYDQSIRNEEAHVGKDSAEVRKEFKFCTCDKGEMSCGRT